MTFEELEQIAAETRENREKSPRELNVCVAAGCLSLHSDAVKKSLEEEVKRTGATCRVRGTGCMGLCSLGPLVSSEPSGQLYKSVAAADATEIVENLEGAPGAAAPVLAGAALFSAPKPDRLGEFRPHRSGKNRRVHRGRRLPGAGPRPHGNEPERNRPGSLQERLAGTRRRRISHGPQVGHGGQNGRHHQVRDLQRRRRRPRRVHGSQRSGKRPASRSGRHGHCRLCGGRDRAATSMFVPSIRSP